MKATELDILKDKSQFSDKIWSTETCRHEP